MSSTEKNSVIVELYDLTLTERKDDRFGRVVTTKSLNEDDLISIVVSRRTDLNPVTIKSALTIVKDVAIEQIANGASVKFGLGYFNLGVSGVFIGDNAKWDSKLHSLFIKAAPSAEVRQAVAAAVVDVRGMASVGVAINNLIDVSSGEESSRLTPGGGVNLTGSKIKIDGTEPSIGLKLINEATKEEVAIPTTSILVNSPSKVTFIVPIDLPDGDYKLSLTTQFAVGNKTIKDPRTCLFDYVLNVTRVK